MELDSRQNGLHLWGDWLYGRCGNCRGMRGSVRRSMHSTSQPMNEVIRRPRSGELHLALFHHDAGGRELVLIALYALAINEVRYVQEHFSALSHPAAYLFV